MTFNLDEHEITVDEFDKLLHHLELEFIDLMKAVLTPEERQRLLDAMPQEYQEDFR